MGRHRIELLAMQMEEAYRPLRNRLAGLTEEEFWWEPVPGSWTLHRRPDGLWYEDYEEPDPEPAPFTTIAWRLFHVASCKVMYHEYAFGTGTLTWEPDSLKRPHTVEGNIALLERGHELQVSALEGLTSDQELDAPRLTNWGERWSTLRILWTMIWHDVHHGAEIGTLRDLYRSSP